VITAPPPEQLIDRAISGSVEALERLLEAIWPDAYRIAYSIVRERAAAEDAAQEACAIVYRKIATLRSAAAFRVWLYRIVTREALRQPQRSAQQSFEAPQQNTPDRESRLDVGRALDSLSPDLRAVVILHYYAELTSKEIAAILSIPAPTVRFRLMLARGRLRPLLEERAERKTPIRSKGLQ